MAVPQEETSRLQRTMYLRHLRTTKVTSTYIARVLKEAANEAEKQLTRLLGDTPALQRERLAVVTHALRENQNALWSQTGTLTREGLEAVTMDAVTGGEDLGRYLSSLADPALRQQITDAARYSAENVRANVLSRVDLSPRVYRNQEVGIKRARRVVERGIAQGNSAKQIASSVRHLINPNTRGGVSYAAMRLARTELNNSFHAVTTEWNDDSPFVEAEQWHLSGSHPRPDKCDEYANGGSAGLPPGQWLTDEVPEKPHPNCFCYVTAITPDRERFLDQLEAGQYDAWLNRQGRRGMARLSG